MYRRAAIYSSVTSKIMQAIGLVWPAVFDCRLSCGIQTWKRQTSIWVLRYFYSINQNHTQMGWEGVRNKFRRFCMSCCPFIGVVTDKGAIGAELVLKSVLSPQGWGPCTIYFDFALSWGTPNGWLRNIP